MSHRRIESATSGGASSTIAPYEYPLVWEFVGKGRYLQAAFCKATAQLYSAKFGILTFKNLTNIAAKGAFLGLLEWSKDIGCCWDESVFVSGASGGNIDILAWLLDNGCPIPKDATACTASAGEGHVEALKFLRVCGLLGDEDTFIVAARNGHLNVLQFAHRFRCEWDVEAAFRTAVENEHIHILGWIHETLLIDGLVNAARTSELAASEAKIEVLKWLKSVGCLCDENICWEAIYSGHLNVLKWAIEEGCPWSVDDQEDSGDTALNISAYFGHLDIVEFFIGCKADLNHPGDAALEGSGTPLFLAAENGRLECVKALLRAGADVNIPNRYNITPLGAAIGENHHEIAELLRAAGGRE